MDKGRCHDDHVAKGASEIDIRIRKVDDGHDCAAAGPGKLVQPEMALEVQERLASDIAELLDL